MDVYGFSWIPALGFVRFTAADADYHPSVHVLGGIVRVSVPDLSLKIINIVFV